MWRTWRRKRRGRRWRSGRRRGDMGQAARVPLLRRPQVVVAPSVPGSPLPRRSRHQAGEVRAPVVVIPVRNTRRTTMTTWCRVRPRSQLAPRHPRSTTSAPGPTRMLAAGGPQRPPKARVAREVEVEVEAVVEAVGGARGRQKCVLVVAGPGPWWPPILRAPVVKTHAAAWVRQQQQQQQRLPRSEWWGCPALCRLPQPSPYRCLTARRARGVVEEQGPPPSCPPRWLHARRAAGRR